MPKLQSDHVSEQPPTIAPLSATVRRHLGQNLRSLYADTLAAPISQRLEALIAQLEKPRR